MSLSTLRALNGSRPFTSVVKDVSTLTRVVAAANEVLQKSHTRNFNRNFHDTFRRRFSFIPSQHLSILSCPISQLSHKGKFLLRSGIELENNLNKNFHTSTSVFNENRNDKEQKENDDKKRKEEEDKMSSLFVKAILWMITAYMFIGLVSLLFPGSNQQEIVRYVSWNEFLYHMLAKGEVEEIIVRTDANIVTIILHEDAVVKAKRVDHRTYHMNIVDMGKFEMKLRNAEEHLGIRPENRVPVIYERNSDTAGKLLAFIVLGALLLAILSRNRTFKNPLNLDNFMQMGRAKFTLVDPTSPGKGVKFADVAGLKEAKIEIMEFVDYLKRPEFYRSLGAKVPRGAVLLGPPGCGKTMLAKAIATEANVPFLSMNGSEFIEMIGGLGAARVRDLFKEAKKRAPCIIYIDEIDAIGKQRTGGTQADGGAREGEQTLNQLLVEMDGMATKEGVLMLASTNRAEVLDKALLRPGRFDRHIYIDLPTLIERREIFEQHLKGIKLDNPPSKFSKRLSALTPGFSGADIANVCNEAALHAARLNQKSVGGPDLEYAIERIVGGTEKNKGSNVMSPEERKIVAYHESGHALVGWMLETTDALLKVTIVPRTNRALGFAAYLPSDQKLYNKEELFERMCMALGGRVAEAITFNRVTTGAQNDLEKVTKIAYAQIRTYGMNKNIGLIAFNDDELIPGRKKPFSKKLSWMMDAEVNKLVGAAYQRTEVLINEHRDKLEMIAIALLSRETLNYHDVEALIGPPPFGKKKLIAQDEFEIGVNEQAGIPPTPSPPSEPPIEEQSPPPEKAQA